MKDTKKVFTPLKKTIALIIVLILAFCLISCNKKVAAPEKDTTKALQKETTIVEGTSEITEATREATPTPTPEPLPKSYYYVCIMPNRDYSLPLTEESADYTNGDIIIELDPNDKTIKAIDIAWLMGIPIESDEMVAITFIYDKIPVFKRAEKMEEVFGIKFDHVLFLNFKAIETAINMAGGVLNDVPDEIIRDNSFNDYIPFIGYMAPNIKTPEELDGAGPTLLTGAQVLNLVFSMPKRITEATGGSHVIINLMNSYIAQRSQKHKNEYVKALRALSAQNTVDILKAMQPDMYFSLAEEDYSDFAELLSICAEGEPENLRMPEDDDFVLEDTDISTVMVCDMEKIRRKVADFFAD